MSYLEEIKAHGRYRGRKVVAIHEISNFAFIETEPEEGESGNWFNILVDGESIAFGGDNLDDLILRALAYKYSSGPVKSTHAATWAAKLLDMPTY